MNLKKKEVRPEIIRMMTKKLAHRGPNDEGIFIDGNVALGHRRLSILDLSSAGHQPMENEKGNLVITFNGEIYNYIEIKKQLGKYAYRSKSDTEVILRAYEKWGEKCLEEFNGIFSFALWDKKKKQFFAARDRLGVKPFYYVIQNGVFYFASEIKALPVAGIPAEPNDKIIYDYLARGYYEHSEETFFKDIKQLMPGYYLICKNGDIKIERYWYLPEKLIDLSKLTDEEIGQRYRDLVKRSVSIQMRSDVPIGINASGGLDCSILTAAVHDILGSQKNFFLYSWVYGEKKYDETPYVKKLAEQFGWQVKFFKLTPQLVLDLLPKVVEHEEQPFPGISVVARHNLYREINSETIVFLEGHGGDEIGGGYEYYFSSFILDIIKTFGPEKALAELRAYAASHDLKTDGEIMKFFTRGLASFLQGGTSADASSFINTQSLNKKFLISQKKQPPEFERPFESFLSNMQYRDLGWTKLPRVLRSVDRNSMAYGKEVRVPFLDHEIVEFAFSLPFIQKIRNGEQRFFMREAFRKKLNYYNVSLPKRAVPDPQKDWLRKELRPWAEEILSSRSFGRRGYIYQKMALLDYKRFCASREPINSFYIWQWLNLELWFRAFID
ncbi:MAG: asparagine synthase (glutamine-hydrolyzing) [Candidatus Tagabacteria bacterium RIFCSPLOWO2_01_FULL_42_9]|uniref:asparagine synthase (glutamine-hydrolyzing) n=1 Tax=Candidatus Tagabacteria bacterium RIFCSPLOWO2_01_FULL_42_9 TaxID=1802296 RepID=A0A1G2LWS1_9BACT|nr:MAG: asparagine synthase (glutamine-hydrolyzing) [Candidatus Tagabacteria bacterium RIFCSPLOWO2_01_FULL_42_9]